MHPVGTTALARCCELKVQIGRMCKFEEVACGLVNSAKEAKIIREKYKNLFIVTPGIRLPGDDVNDQSRVMTPNDAFKNKVSGIVMGRSLVKGNIKNNIKRLINHLNQ